MGWGSNPKGTTPMNSTTAARKDPKTKAQLLDRMMSYDFSGDIHDLAAGRDLSLERIKPNAVRLKFGGGSSFDLTVHKPRTLAQAPADSGKPDSPANSNRQAARKNPRQQSRAAPARRKAA